MGRVIYAAVLLLALVCIAQAADPVDVVTTTDGKTFNHVNLVSVKGDPAVPGARKVLLSYQNADGAIETVLVALDSLPDYARRAWGLPTRAMQGAMEAQNAARKAKQDAFESEQAKKGLVKYGNDWVTPEDAAAEQAVDAEPPERGVEFQVSQALKTGSLCYRGRNGDGALFFLYGLTNKIAVDGDILKGDLYYIGNLTFTNVYGAARTVRSYAVDRKLAIEQAKVKLNLVPHDGESPPATKSAGLDNVRGFGTGFAISEDGYIITAYHVIRDAKFIRVKTETELLDAKVVASDPDNDLALLKVNKKTECVALSSARTASLGQTVFTVGFPMPDLQGFSPKVTKGVISGLKGIRDDVRKYQIDASIQPGNSGGPVADERGNIVGVAVSSLNDAAILEEKGVVPQNVNYSVKLSYVLALVDATPEVAKKIHVAKDTEKVSFEEAVEKVRKASVLIASY